MNEQSIGSIHVEMLSDAFVLNDILLQLYYVINPSLSDQELLLVIALRTSSFKKTVDSISLI